MRSVSKFKLRWEDSPSGKVVAIYEEVGYGVTGTLEARIGTYYPRTRILHLTFGGKLEDLATLMEQLRDFLKARGVDA